MNKNAKFICAKLQGAGFQAYIVGGCMRDTIIGITPKDWDICTDASPEQVASVFEGFKILNIGEAFGISSVIVNGETFEIARMRVDGSSSDSRHPDSIRDCSSIEEDLARRDFTMNAIASDPLTGRIIDPFCGGMDIADKVIDFVGNPVERIAEDNLRILRAFRFASTLGFTIAPETLSAITRFFSDGGDFSNISAERISTEFRKIVLGKNAFNVIHLMLTTGILDKIVPEVAEMRTPHNSKYHTEEMEPFGNSILAHVMFVFKYACKRSDNLNVRLAALFHDIGKNRCREAKNDGTDRFLFHDRESARMTSEILKRLRFDGSTIDTVVNMVFDHMNVHNLTKMKDVAKIRKMLGKPNFNDLFMLGICDTMGTSGGNRVPNVAAVKELITCVENFRSQFTEMLPKALVTGDDLIASGMKPSVQFAHALDSAFCQQLRGMNDKGKLLRHALGTFK
jgi:tRNA nucleotidyltransferase (CCA-adding enzyme)